MREGDAGMRIPSGCAICGIMNVRGKRIGGTDILRSIAMMHERSNGLGGGFAAYGIYPKYRDYYAFHMLFDSEDAKEQTEELLKDCVLIKMDELIPTRNGHGVESPPLIWRYFVEVPDSVEHEEEHIVDVVMKINSGIKGAYTMSSGKNMGVFKGVGYPEDIGRFYQIEKYSAYTWTAHGRFPTNTPGWWGGAHPFNLLDWTVVHNGEISSYGINKRFIEMFGYMPTLRTDSEVITYLFDLLVRRHRLTLQQAATVLAPPFWKDIDRMAEKERDDATRLRAIYGSAMLNGPFSIIVGHSRGMIGLNDRIKLRPMTAARKGDFVYMASEECAIREVAPEVDTMWNPRGGEAVMATLTEEAA